MTVASTDNAANRNEYPNKSQHVSQFLMFDSDDRIGAVLRICGQYHAIYLALLQSNDKSVTIVSEEVISNTVKVNCIGLTDLSLFGCGEKHANTAHNVESGMTIVVLTQLFWGKNHGCRTVQPGVGILLRHFALRSNELIS